jgi:hypothetical protein
MRQELGERDAQRTPVTSGHVHRDFGRGELVQALATAAARRARAVTVADHGDLDDAARAAGDQGADGAGLGALALRIGGVLDIGAGEHLAGLGTKRAADAEARIGRVGVCLDGAGGFEQILHRSFT